MLGRIRQSRPNEAPKEDIEPLLGDNSQGVSGSQPSRRVLFAVDEYGDEQESDAHNSTSTRSSGEGRGLTRRRRDDEYVVPPTLRSTFQSREAQFELDPDELDIDPATVTGPRHTSRTTSDRNMPLLVGLLDSSRRRRSLDLPLHSAEDEIDPLGSAVDLEGLAAKRLAGGGMLDSIANMANSILGAGIIGLPYALNQAGFFVGIILLVALCGLTDWTIRLIVLNAKLSGRSSYIEIMDHCFGPSGKAAVSFFQFAFAFGGMCAFGIIIGDTIPQVIRSIFPSLATTPLLSILVNRQFVIALCTICVSYPLSLHRDISKLARASGFALAGMLIIVTSVLIEGPHVPDELKGSPRERLTIIQPQIFQAIGVISFAFVCHHNSLLIYGSLKTPTLDRFAKVTHISTFMSLVACMTMAVSAYTVFTDKTQGNILNNFSKTNLIINVARFCFGLNMFTTLPLELFVCREVVEQFWFAHEAFSYQRHLLFTTSILFSSMFLSMITCDLGVMLEITGGVSATALAFIFPAACYLQLSDKRVGWTSRTKLPAVLCVGFGIIVMVLSLCIALTKVWTAEGKAKICV